MREYNAFCYLKCFVDHRIDVNSRKGIYETMTQRTQTFCQPRSQGPLHFSRRQLDGLWNLWRWKNLAKNLEMTTTTVSLNGPRGEFNLFFQSRNHNVLIRLELNTSYAHLQSEFWIWLNCSHRRFDCHFLILQREISINNFFERNKID